MASRGQYRDVVDDLMKQRFEYQNKIADIDIALSALRKLMPEEIGPTSATGQPSLPIGIGKYSGMSVRWGILHLLAEDATEGMSTGDVAVRLQAGGVVSKGKNFAGNVSAVLSEMNRLKQEVISEGDGWKLTEKGKEAHLHAKSARARQLDPNGS